jgi:hypothetical protein
VGDVGDQLPARGVGAAHLTELVHDPPGHLLDGEAQLIDLVAAPAAPGRQAHGPLEVALLVGLDRRGQPAQAAGQPVEREQPGHQGQQQADRRGAGRQAQDVAGLDHLGHGVVQLAPQHRVDVALEPAPAHDRRGAEDLAPALVPGIVAQDRQGRPAVQERGDRRQGDPLALDLAGRRRIGHQAALRVDQIDLDPRVDHHQHVEHFLQGRLVHLAVLDQRLGLDDVVGQGPVEALVDLLDVEPGHHQGEAQVDQAEQTDQRQKGGHQLAVEGSEHEPYPARRSLNL